MKIEYKFIGQIEKNLSEVIKAHIYKWRGSEYLDLRIFYRPRGAEPSAEIPTKKGFKFNVELIDEFLNLLRMAEKKISQGDEKND